MNMVVNRQSICTVKAAPLRFWSLRHPKNVSLLGFRRNASNDELSNGSMARSISEIQTKYSDIDKYVYISVYIHGKSISYSISRPAELILESVNSPELQTVRATQLGHLLHHKLVLHVPEASTTEVDFHLGIIT